MEKDVNEVCQKYQDVLLHLVVICSMKASMIFWLYCPTILNLWLYTSKIFEIVSIGVAKLHYRLCRHQDLKSGPLVFISPL